MSEGRGRRPPEAPRSPRQARMGPAPFASFEDLSDEVRPKGDSPDEKPIIRLPDISEDDTISKTVPPDPGGEGPQGSQPPAAGAMENLGPNATTATGNLQTPSTPRIDISRASSSSHHDSRDSSPENAIFGISDSIHDPEGAKLGLGFREDGAADLRSSTEELAFLEPNAATVEKESSKQPSLRSPLMFKPEDHHRKDSQCSDIVLLSISGRTSRLSSIGSQGSAHSNISAHSNMSHMSVHSNVSHISGQSRLSVISGISRSPSPHKMLLETSFCGPKPLENEVGVIGVDKNHTEVLEQVLLARKHDPKDAILAEGISVNQPKEPSRTTLSAKSAVVEKRHSISSVEIKERNGKMHPPEAIRKESITSPTITVSTLGASYKSETKPVMKIVKVEPPVKSKPLASSGAKKAQSKPAKSTGSSETEYIRIKLKPDHMYEDEGDPSGQQESMQKPITLNLSEHPKKNAPHFSQLVKREDSLNKISHYPETTDVQLSAHAEKSYSSNITTVASPKQKGLKDREHGSRTPSPAGKTPSRKSSFCSLFKSRETIASPESPTGSVSKRKGLTSIIKDASGSIHSSRSRSKSRERDKSGNGTPTSAGKSKGSMLAIFKPSRKSSASSSPVARESLPNLDSADYKHSAETRSATNLRQTAKERLKYYDQPVDGFIRIPLHTPSDEEKPLDKDKEKPPPPKSTREENVIHQMRVERPVDRPVSAPSSSRPSFSNPIVSERAKKHDSGIKNNPGAKQIILPDGSIRIPLHSPSEDRLVRCDLMSAEEAAELNRRCSNISTKKNGNLDKSSAGSGLSSSTDVSTKNEEKFVEPEKAVEKKPPEPIIHSEPVVSEPESVVEQVEVQIEDRPNEEKLSSQAKKHIIFTTKVGSKEQLFSTQFSLSKTDSQSSQISDNRSQISEESVIEVPLSERRCEEQIQRTPSLENRCESRTCRNSPETRNQSIEQISMHAFDKTETRVSSMESIESHKATTIKEPPPSAPRNPVLTKTDTVCSRSSVLSADEAMHDSSESERDSELDFIRKKQLLALEKAGKPEPVEVDHERKNLVLQQDSFDDELPYVPTTLPQERSVALPIVPVKQRQTIEMRTCPIERPRSTTPINPSCLEEYCSDDVYTPDSIRAERLKISLPKDETGDKPKIKHKAKSPRRISAGSNPKTWFEFAEQGISNSGTRKSSTGQESDSDPAPPLPPRASVPKTQWINFENIPERRKVPKRIQTIPSRTNVEVAGEANVVYTYVNPEDCKCECHESGKDTDVTPDKDEDEEPLLDESVESEGLSAPPVESIARRKSDKRTAVGDQGYYSQRPTMGTPRIGVAFTKDTNSNRSSVASQDADRSSSSGSPNDVVLPPRRPPRSP